MKVLMLVCRDESIEFTPEDRQSIGPQVQAWVSEMEERGVRLQGDVLAPVNATTTVSGAALLEMHDLGSSPAPKAAVRHAVANPPAP